MVALGDMAINGYGRDGLGELEVFSSLHDSVIL